MQFKRMVAVCLSTIMIFEPAIATASEYVEYRRAAAPQTIIGAQSGSGALDASGDLNSSASAPDDSEDSDTQGLDELVPEAPDGELDEAPDGVTDEELGGDDPIQNPDIQLPPSNTDPVDPEEPGAPSEIPENGDSHGEENRESDGETAGDGIDDDGDPIEDPALQRKVPHIAGVTYESHVQDIGWQKAVTNGKMAGTVGKSKQMEALKISLESDDEEIGQDQLDDMISIAAHVATIGWKEPVSGGAIAGTVGEALGIEALRINLNDNLSTEYSIWYRVHSAEFGWLDWAHDGLEAGSAGYGRAVQAVEIRVLKKGEAAPGPAETPFRDRADDPASIIYTPHVQNIGWMSSAKDGQVSGTTGRALNMEALNLSLDWYGHDAGIQARGHVSDIGWQGWSNGSLGTTGQSRQLEAVQLKLTGEAAQVYDIWYRVHIAQRGWLGWTSNGAPAGSTGESLGVQAIQVEILPKGQSAPGSTSNAFVGTYNKIVGSGIALGGRSLSFKESKSGFVLGDAAGSDTLRSFAVDLENTTVDGGIEYRVYRQFSDWQQSWAGNGRQVSEDGSNTQIKAVELRLTGQLSQDHDLWYRVYDSLNGWLGWTRNARPAGRVGGTSAIKAVEVAILKKGSAAPGETGNSFLDASSGPILIYQGHVSEAGWLAAVGSKEIAGQTGKRRALQALRIRLDGADATSDVQISSHVQGIGWQGYASKGSVSGTTGKNLPIEAVRAKLTGPISNQYDLYYRLHVEEYGWLGWAKNDQAAGSTGLARQAEAIEFRLVEKGSQGPSSDVPPVVVKPSLQIEASVQGMGWRPPVSDGGIAGTTGTGKAISSLKLSVSSELPGGIEYSTHLDNVGWQEFVSNGDISGDINGRLRVQAAKIRLTGELSKYFDVWYRAHVQDLGWLGWTKNGKESGSTGLNYRMEALQVSILPKGAAAPGSTESPYVNETSEKVLGVSRIRLLGWLNSNLYNGYYLGTRYSGSFTPETCMYPKGAPRWDGFTGMNCTGFVAHAYRAVGGNLAAIGANNNHSPWAGGPGGGYYINAWRWYGYAVDSGAKIYTFNTVAEMLRSGVAKKGDIIFFKTNGAIDCHIGFFWGDTPYENKMWHQILPGNLIGPCFNNANKGEVNQQVCLIR